VFPVAALVWSSRQGWSSEPGAGQGSPGMASANLIAGAALYCVGDGAASLLMGTFGWLGLRGGVKGAQRKLHIAEIVIGSPGVLLAGLTVAWLQSGRLSVSRFRRAMRRTARDVPEAPEPPG